MSGNRTSADVAAGYLRENFRPEDRLAIVLVHKRTGVVLQRIASAERIAAPDFQAWLRHKNAGQNEVYVSMNVLKPDAHGRTKSDVETIRHVYLDFDENGTEALERLLKRPDLPQPNHVVSSSPGKWQVVWKVEGFGKEQAEELQRGLARETGADPAATDCSRVLRLPGFYNHKYARIHLVTVQSLSKEIYGPERFPKVPTDERRGRPPAAGVSHRSKPSIGGRSQSERDWAFAKRALARGDSGNLVIAAIATWRRFDKHNPQYYAELTVKKAAESLKVDSAERAHADPDR